MTLGEVLPGLQDNALDGAVSAMTVLNSMQFQRVAKYVTEIDQPAIFGITELSKKWYDTLPADLQQIVDRDATAAATGLNPSVIDFNARARRAWTGCWRPTDQPALRRTGGLVADIGQCRHGCLENKANAGRRI